VTCHLCNSDSVQHFFPYYSTLQDLPCQQAVVFFCIRFLWRATLHNLVLGLKTQRNCHAYWNMQFVFCSLFPIFLVENVCNHTVREHTKIVWSQDDILGVFRYVVLVPDQRCRVLCTHIGSCYLCWSMDGEWFGTHIIKLWLALFILSFLAPLLGWGFTVGPFSLSQKVPVIITGILMYATDFSAQHDVWI